MPYHRLLRRMHQFLRPRTYVEIGVRNGNSLRHALPGTVCVGIDPEPNIPFRIPRTTHIYSETSDRFFVSRDVHRILGGPIDLAFIDGMHLFEFALRDFLNLERHCTPHSVILVHDCYPTDGVTAARERQTDLWSGDVWKLILCLKQHRPDLSVATVDVGPSGLGIIYRLDPDSRVLDRDFAELSRHYMALGYDAIASDKAGALNRIPHDWPAIQALLEPCVRPSAETQGLFLNLARRIFGKIRELD